MWQLTLEVKTFSRVLLLTLLAISAILSWVEFTWADSTRDSSLRDPTQVPAEMLTAEPAKNGATHMIEQAGGAPVLQSVMLGAQYRAAIINGKKVKLGERYEKATLVALSENTATLRNEDGSKQILKMLDGDVKKTSVKMSFSPPKRQTNSAQNAEKMGDATLINNDSNPKASMK